jgi:hypothetical protein
VGVVCCVEASCALPPPRVQRVKEEQTSATIEKILNAEGSIKKRVDDKTRKRKDAPDPRADQVTPPAQTRSRPPRRPGHAPPRSRDVTRRGAGGAAPGWPRLRRLGLGRLGDLSSARANPRRRPPQSPRHQHAAVPCCRQQHAAVPCCRQQQTRP